MIALVVAFAAAFAALAAAASGGTDLPPHIQAATDAATFRRFTLDNGMRVLLVSDPKFNRSAASLVVNVGQIDDPPDIEGLAHFLEHMLFLGTEKYPAAGEYGHYLRTNGGRNNAYTSSDHTNYHFEVRHEALAGALDRFAQFFIAPKFNPEFVGREVNAVHNEAMRHVQNDERRRVMVLRELYDRASGESKFSTGNRETLARATPLAVRAFFEAHYSADRMALSIAGKAPLDELEQLARTSFSGVPLRNVEPVVRDARFLPRKPVLRLVKLEPVKEVRLLSLEFVLPATRRDFASKPVRLVDELLSHPGPGGLVDALKAAGLATAVRCSEWQRTGEYGSLFVDIQLTREGERGYARVLEQVFSFLDHLRKSAFPATFYAERARIAELNETYADRGEGMPLVIKLANQALFYPLEVAERATDVWGKPDDAAYRRVLAALTPDNMLVALVAKGVPTERRERIYGTAYSYRESAGAEYQALVGSQRTAAFTLPGENPFTPKQVTITPERPLALISEPGVQLYYAQDVEFQRPQTTLVFRFVPTRDIATASSAALLQLYEKSLQDFLEPMLGEAQLAGNEVSIDATVEGLRLVVTGYGESPQRVAAHIAAQLKVFELAPKQFDAVKEALVRSHRSYREAEAYLLARDRRDALAREVHFVPTQLLARTEEAQWSDVRAFAQRFFAIGKLEALVHGHATPEAAVALTREIAGIIDARPAGPDALMYRRHRVVRAGETLVDVAEIAGVNSAVMLDYVLPDDRPQTRAAALVASNFLRTPFYTEIRTRQQLGYIVNGAAEASQRHRYFSFIVQSSGYAPDELQRRAERVIAMLPERLAGTTDDEWNTLVAGARSTLEERPKSVAQKARLFFDDAFIYGGEWDRREAALAALQTLTREQAVALLADALGPERASRRVVLLYSSAHPVPKVPGSSHRRADRREEIQ